MNLSGIPGRALAMLARCARRTGRGQTIPVLLALSSLTVMFPIIRAVEILIVLFHLRPPTAMFPAVGAMESPLLRPAARLHAALAFARPFPAVLVLHHGAQFLHLPCERANLVVHRLQG
ncbi:MAG: hypothetical protein ABI318_23310 [Chthoniobacteraceae bacterium]